MARRRKVTVEDRKAPVNSKSIDESIHEWYLVEMIGLDTNHSFEFIDTKVLASDIWREGFSRQTTQTGSIYDWSIDVRRCVDTMSTRRRSLFLACGSLPRNRLFVKLQIAPILTTAFTKLPSFVSISYELSLSPVMTSLVCSQQIFFIAICPAIYRWTHWAIGWCFWIAIAMNMRQSSRNYPPTHWFLITLSSPLSFHYTSNNPTTLNRD